MSKTQHSGVIPLHVVHDPNIYDATLAACRLQEPVTLVEQGALTGEYVGRHRAESPSSHGDEPVATAVIGEGHTPRLGRWLFSRSRFRRAKVLDALAVALLLAVVAALGCAVVMLGTGTAKADSSDALAYAAEYGPAVCMTLDDYPTFGGIIGIGRAIVDQTGMSYHDAGQAIGYSVSELCPRHMGLLARFIATNTHRTPVAGVA